MTIAVDFDGVIHRYSKGWADGTIYDPLMEGAREGLRALMEQQPVFVFTTREAEAVMPWLEGHGFSVTIDERCSACLGDGRADCSGCHGSGQLTFWDGRDQLLITNRKLPAVAYLDDRAVRFTNWHQARAEIQTAIGGLDEEYPSTWGGGHALVIEYGDCELYGRCQCGERFGMVKPDKPIDRFAGKWERHVMLGLGKATVGSD